MVPKILSPLVKDWAPQAFVTSFKLETDASILLDKARRALDTYRHQAVVANVLDSRRGYVVVVTPETQAELILSEDDVKNEVEIEERIVSNLTSEHSRFMTQAASEKWSPRSLVLMNPRLNLYVFVLPTFSHLLYGYLSFVSTVSTNKSSNFMSKCVTNVKKPFLYNHNTQVDRFYIFYSHYNFTPTTPKVSLILNT